MDPAIEPADFSTGIVVDAYAALRSVTFDATPYHDFVRGSGEPGLELACGDDGPFLTLAEEGVDIEGVDSSADMLLRGARRAAERGIRLVAHHQRMEQLDLPRRCRSIYLVVAEDVDDEARDWIMHRHTEAGFAALAADAGLAVASVDETAPGESVVLLRHA